MKKRPYSMLSMPLLVALALGSAAHAAPITGKIDITSLNGVTLNATSLATATNAKFDKTPYQAVATSSGSFAAIGAANSTVNMTGTTWNFTTGVPINSFWSVGGFTFNLNSSTVVPGQTAYFLQATGTGTITGPSGYTPATGRWTFTATDASGGTAGTSQFSFTSSTSVPDGGTTITLLGLSLLGLHGARRKFASR